MTVVVVMIMMMHSTKKIYIKETEEKLSSNSLSSFTNGKKEKQKNKKTSDPYLYLCIALSSCPAFMYRMGARCRAVSRMTPIFLFSTPLGGNGEVDPRWETLHLMSQA